MSTLAVKILVVDDEPAIRRLLRVGLSANGHAVIEASSGAEAMEILGMGGEAGERPHAGEAGEACDGRDDAQDVQGAGRRHPDLIVLDLGLPDMSGLELLQMWRAAGIVTPVIILSSRTDETGIVEALELGADDYLVKPFGMRELAARIRVALRHKLQQQGERPVFQTGALSVDLVKRLVRVSDREVKLSPKEYDILRILVQHAGKVITHQHIMRQVWGNAADVQYLRVYVRQLRLKIEHAPDQPHYILTETGVGYRLREADP